MADKWQGCFGIKKGKVPTKEVWTINAKSYESAIRSIKKSALSNYRDNHKESTLFYNGHAVGWAFRTMEKSSTWTRTRCRTSESFPSQGEGDPHGILDRS